MIARNRGQKFNGFERDAFTAAWRGWHVELF
jgi:hypothetical protein